MRTQLVAAAAWLGLMAVPVVALAAGPAPGAAGGVVVAQSQSSGTVLPGVTVTAPRRENDPFDISTWRFHAGPNPYAPKAEHFGIGLGGGKTSGTAPPGF
jgi:hypothetical protein